MALNSVLLLENISHQTDGVEETVVGDRKKGDGFYNRSDGLHTVQYTIVDLSGSVNIQATLEVDPTEGDWFTVFSKSFVEENASEVTNFTGNYVWIRAKIVFTDGAVTSIWLNH
jgi:hypothetical protein